MSSKWYSKKWVIVMLHIAAWVLLFSLPYLLRPSLNDGRHATQNSEPAMVHLRYALNNLIYIGFFYLNAGLLISQFIYKRKYNQYGAIIPVSFIILSFASVIFPISISLPLDIKYPELFPGLTVPMHFFPALAWFTIRPLFMTEIKT